MLQTMQWLVHGRSSFHLQNCCEALVAKRRMAGVKNCQVAATKTLLL